MAVEAGDDALVAPLMEKGDEAGLLGLLIAKVGKEDTGNIRVKGM